MSKQKQENMEHSEKINFLKEWVFKNKAVLLLEGECGFGRECVGITIHDNYIEYDDDANVFIPEDAYHKHPCVAVLGRGEEAEAQLYDWVKWFEDNDMKPQTTIDSSITHPVQILLGQHRKTIMRKKLEVQGE